MDLDKDILQKLQEYWPEKWEDIIAQAERIEKRIPTRYDAKKEVINRVKGHEYVLKFEQDTLKAIIPKDQLKDGVTYIAMEGTGSLTRHTEEARWDEKIGMFYYTRTKFGHTFEDTMHHFADAIDIGLAGFTPIKEKDVL